MKFVLLEKKKIATTKSTIRFILAAAAVSSNSMSSVQQQSSSPSVSVSALLSLEQIYSNILAKSNALSSYWPQNDQFRSLMEKVVDDDEKDNAGQEQQRLLLRPPHFPNNDGPIGVYALLSHNTAAQSILSKCSTEAFEQFIQDAQPYIKNNKKKAADDKAQSAENDDNDNSDWWYYKPNPKTYHICITIIQEHPRLLVGDEEMLKAYRAIDESQTQQLINELGVHLIKQKSPTLQLHCLLWTPDGALIAGFIEKQQDDDQASVSYLQRIRQTITSTSTKVLEGPLTSRPKQLIHVTLGRVLVPRGDIENEEKLLQLIKEMNSRTLPSLVQSICMDESLHKGCFTIDNTSLIREIVWMCNSYTELDNYQLI